jgi:hypothetical protein
MNSQELRALQEAYSQVYELNEKFSDDTKRRATRHIKDTKKLLRSMGTEIDDKYNPEPEGYEPKSDKKIKKKTQKEQVDLYDIILSHLLDEGYADTQEQAEVIMVNMSEDWRESICEGYVPLRTSDEHYDDEGFPTTTRSWSNKMTDARIGVGKVKDRSRRNSGDPIGNLTKGVSAKKRLDAMKKVDDEPESVRAKRSQAKAAANRQLGTNRRSLQTSLDREHLTKSLKSS